MTRNAWHYVGPMVSFSTHPALFFFLSRTNRLLITWRMAMTQPLP
jgi:hypothetical protein